jgi:hypothetical protein
MMTNEEAQRFMREHFLFITVPLVPVKKITYYTSCYGCGVPMLDGEEYRPEFCSAKCYCETSCIDREDG